MESPLRTSSPIATKPSGTHKDDEPEDEESDLEDGTKKNASVDEVTKKNASTEEVAKLNASTEEVSKLNASTEEVSKLNASMEEVTRNDAIVEEDRQEDKSQKVSGGRDDNEDAGEDEETKTPLIEDESVRIDMIPDGDGNDTATLPLKKDKKDDPIEISKNKPPIHIFPITRMKLAWTSSSSICEFFVRAVFIIFSTLGWLFCIGGIPLMSLVMLILGAVYKNDCNIQPNIPTYLIVAGVFGTMQHFVAVWTKYIPKESQGKLGIYRAYCRVIDGTMQLFLLIWFVLGCIWVYGVYDRVDYYSKYKDEYCHKTLYLFAFWMLNISFIALAFLAVAAMCCIVCIVATPKKTADNKAAFE